LTDFMQQLNTGWKKYETRPELRDLLEQNFLRYDGAGAVPSQIHSYLSTNFKDLRNLDKDDALLRAKARDRWYVPDPNKASDLEKIRERHLLKEFDDYRESIGSKGSRRRREFRLEALRAGFKRAWQERDYRTIVDIGQRLPEDVLTEDTRLLMWFDQSRNRLGE
jgi:hypothetical protein